jgi:hypothetical protein
MNYYLQKFIENKKDNKGETSWEEEETNQKEKRRSPKKKRKKRANKHLGVLLFKFIELK